MQYEISDEAAVAFARDCYRALSAGDPIDAAVAEGRKGISLLPRKTFEWGIPVLHMRSPNGVLFELPKIGSDANIQVSTKDESLFTSRTRRDEDKNSRKSWWLTIPGILAGTGTTIGAITALIVALHPAVLFDSKDEKPRPVLQVDALVNCTTAWDHNNMLPTRIKFQQDEQINIKATGEWWGSKGDQGKGGPDGIGDDYAGIRLGALVGKIGTGRLFLIGRIYSGHARVSGELYLGFWDNYCEDNAGAVLVEVNGGKPIQ
jgi:hypothetical protein